MQDDFDNDMDLPDEELAEDPSLDDGDDLGDITLEVEEIEVSVEPVARASSSVARALPVKKAPLKKAVKKAPAKKAAKKKPAKKKPAPKPLKKAAKPAKKKGGAKKTAVKKKPAPKKKNARAGKKPGKKR